MIVEYFYNLYKKNIVSKSNGKFDSVITWPLDIPVSSIMKFIILHCFNLLYFSQIYCTSGKRFPFFQIIHCKLSIMVIVGKKRVSSDISTCTCIASIFNLQLRI